MDTHRRTPITLQSRFRWSVKPMRRSDFSYDLPKHLIARTPLPARTDSRLLELKGDAVAHRRFGEIVDLLRRDDLLVVNDTRVIKARLRAVKDSGGRAEVLIERIEGADTALCQVRVSKALHPERSLLVRGEAVTVLERRGEFYLLRFPGDVLEFLDAHGSTPLPPYIARPANAEDEKRYQTVYGKHPGAVAAPTAGLHFDGALLRAIEDRGVGVAAVTLHVGAGTFQPVRTEDLSRHRMHEERYEVPEATAKAVNACSGRIVAVGTTVVRTLESAADGDGRVRTGTGETSLFIAPGYAFRVIDALVTNFHLPESTLLMLVSAFAGHARIMRAYAEAVREGYRLFSYGDAMFCERA